MDFQTTDRPVIFDIFRAQGLEVDSILGKSIFGKNQ